MDRSLFARAGPGWKPPEKVAGSQDCGVVYVGKWLVGHAGGYGEGVFGWQFSLPASMGQKYVA